MKFVSFRHSAATVAATVAESLLSLYWCLKNKALQAEQRKVSREWKCQMQHRQPLLSPESHSCMHSHSRLLNAKLIVIHSCLK